MRWPEPTAEDVNTFMSTVVTTRADSDSTRTPKVLTVMILQVRGAISAAGTSPLSANEQGVPPEGLKHVLVLCVAALLTSAPNLEFLLAGEFGKMLEEAREWLKRVSDGAKVSQPDEVLEGSETSLVQWGDQELTDEMRAT